MKKEDLDRVLYELKVFLSEKDYEELMNKGQVVLLDENKRRSRFIEKPRVERVVLKMHSPLIFVYVTISIGLHRIEVPALCYSMAEGFYGDEG